MSTTTSAQQTGPAMRIPSCELSGSPAMRLLHLESVLLQARALRRRIEQEARPQQIRREPSARGWWIAGVAIVTALALLTLWSGVTASATQLMVPTAVHHRQ
jgi:hypothetical protein